MFMTLEEAAATAGELDFGEPLAGLGADGVDNIAKPDVEVTL